MCSALLRSTPSPTVAIVALRFLLGFWLARLLDGEHPVFGGLRMGAGGFDDAWIVSHLPHFSTCWNAIFRFVDTLSIPLCVVATS